MSVSAPAVTYKTLDTSVPLVAILTNSAGTPIDLTNATHVEVVMKGQNTSTLITGACVIGSPATGGQVTYSWGASDLAVADIYSVEWLITWPTSASGVAQYQTVPNAAAANPTIEVDARLDGATG